eukprot:scaffold2093_cov96-Isochrysis_galbana.AAC.3
MGGSPTHTLTHSHELPRPRSRAGIGAGAYEACRLLRGGQHWVGEGKAVGQYSAVRGEGGQGLTPAHEHSTSMKHEENVTSGCIGARCGATPMSTADGTCTCHVRASLAQ